MPINRLLPQVQNRLNYFYTVSLKSRSIFSDSSIKEGSSTPTTQLFVILQVMKNKMNHQATRHYAENCINKNYFFLRYKKTKKKIKKIDLIYRGSFVIRVLEVASLMI
jgi:predicted nucleotidyltransferase